MFATKEQLSHLSNAKSWYIDATFKLCRQPFSQLMTINAFVRHDDYVKQVPLVFVLMSGRKKSDYKKVTMAYLRKRSTVNSRYSGQKKLKKKIRFTIKCGSFYFYFQVLKKVLEVLPNAPKVRRVIVDFERAVWSAIRRLLPAVEVKGCVFHWTQALWRKVSKHYFNFILFPFIL